MAWTGIIVPGPLIGMLLLLAVLVYPSRLTSLVQPSQHSPDSKSFSAIYPSLCGRFFPQSIDQSATAHAIANRGN